jgi:RNA polymerase-binding transcription factor DksA
VTLTPEERDSLQALLASEKGRTAATEAALVAELEAIIEASALSNSDDEHDPEGATVGFERARVASQLEAARRRLSELDEAAERLGTAAFGTCRQCGKTIAFERLAVHPTAMTCVACAGTPARPALRRRAGP